MTVTSNKSAGPLLHLSRYLGARAHASHAAETAEAEPPPRLTIALSRQAGALGSEVAREAGALLGWPVYDRELVQLISDKYKLSGWAAASLDEHHVGWLESLARGIGAYDHSQTGSYLRGLRESLAALGGAGHCVIVGRGAAHALPPQTTLSVRVVASRPWRIAQAQKQGGFSAAEAARWVDRMDGERRVFVKEYFGADVDDPTQYGLVLNVERLGVASCADVIVHEARAIEAQLAKRPVAATA